MGDNSAIEWTDATWNPLVGCEHAGPGCDNCYAARLMLRGLHDTHRGMSVRRPDGTVRFTGEIRLRPDMLDQPLRWRKPRRIFVNSLSDLFHRDVPVEYIARVFAVMAATPHHTYQVLTKRPQRMAEVLGERSSLLSLRGDGPAHFLPLMVRHMARLGVEADAWPLPNVWLGTSIENDRYAFRADHLRRAPAAVRFISAEPLLGPLPSLDLTGIDWLIVGGESGPGARPMHPDWVRDLRDRCTESPPCPGRDGGEHWSSTCMCVNTDETAFFFKQWGEWLPWEEAGQPFWSNVSTGELVDGHRLPSDLNDGEPTGGWWCPLDDTDERMCVYQKVGKKAAGRVLDGRTWDEMP